jgi:hypothetical protein
MKALKLLFLLFIANHAIAAQDTITAVKAKDYIGKTITVCDRITYGVMVNINKNTPTILYVGPDYPNHYLSLYIPRHVVRRFSFDPEKKMINKRFCATGKITMYKASPLYALKANRR